MWRIMRLLVTARSVAVLAIVTADVEDLAAESCWADNRVNGNFMCSWTECDFDGDGYSDAPTFNGCFQRDDDDEDSPWEPIGHPQ